MLLSISHYTQNLQQIIYIISLKDFNNKYIYILGVQKSSELFFVKFNLYSKTNEKIWLAA